MPAWYYDQDAFHKTPSIQDGLDYETECAYRKEGARFIMDIGTQMDLGCNTMATGVVFFHRFYMFHSFVAFPRFVTASCCIFLAGKVEETPKKCKDIIKIAQTLLNEEAFASFGLNPKEEVMTLEKILLKTIKFDFKVEHPYYYLIKYAKHLKGDKNRLHKMVQMAWTFINDSLCTTLCLQWEPEIIAIALMYLAGKLSKFKVVSWVYRKSNHAKWWDMFVEKLPMSTLEDICHQVLDLYSTVKDILIPQESQQSQSQTMKKDLDIKLENPVKLEKIDTQPIQVKEEFDSNVNPIKHEPSIDSTLAVTIKKNPYCNPRIAKETYSTHKPIKHDPSIDSTLAVNIKNEPEFSQLYDLPKPKIMLHVADWAAVSASAIMSPGTSSVNSPTFATPNFLVSPVPVGSFNYLFNESTIQRNVNFNKTLPENCQDSKNVSATLLSNQDSANSDDATRHIGQSLNYNKLRIDVPLDNCRDNLPKGRRGFTNFNDTLPKSSREFDNCNDNLLKSSHGGFVNCNDNLPTSIRAFGNCNKDVPFRSRGFNNCEVSAPFGNRGFDNCEDSASFGNRGFDKCENSAPFVNRGFDKCEDSAPFGNRGFDKCEDSAPFVNRGFDKCEDTAPFGNRGFNNINENLMDNNYNFKIADFSKNYQSCNMFIQDYPDSKDLYNKFKYSAKMRNERDPRTNSRDYPYPNSKSDFCMDSFPESNNNPYESNEINLERYRSRHTGLRFRHARRFHGPMNN